MNKTPDQLAADIVTFCNHVFEPLAVPKVQQQVISHMPVELIVGVTIEGFTPQEVLEACTLAARHAALKATWPVNMIGGPRATAAISADGVTVIFNLVLYSVNLVAPDSLSKA